MLIEASNVTFGYGGRPVVRVDTFELGAARCTGIFGANGSGKSTLVRGLTGLLAPLTGVVKRRDGLRIAYVPQHRDMELHWPMTALDAAAMATSARRAFGWLGAGVTRVRQLLSDLGVADLANKRFATLSGGQQQRVLLAGSLATDPDLLVLDEPTEGLDVRSRHLLLDIVRSRVERGLGAAIISHDVEDLLHLCPQVAWLHPAADHDAPTRVEMTSAGDLAQRVTTVGAAS